MSNRRKTKPQPNPMTGDGAPPPERQFYTVAFLCGMLQQPPSFIDKMMRLAHVSFAYTENGVGYLNGADVQKMASMLAETRAAVEDAQHKAAAAASN